MPQTRIAIAGAGTIGQVHLAAVQQDPALYASAVVDPAPAAAALAARAGVPWYASLDALLAQDRPDGIVLATPNALHLPQALQCMAAGLPMLLEKPIATTVAEAETLVHAAERAGARVLIGHHRAHSPIMATAQAVVQSGQLGRLVAVTGSAMFYKPDAYFSAQPWRSQAGGGPILLNLIHEVHNLRMLCGEVVAVQAMASHAVRNLAVEDTVSISLRFASGVLGSFMLSDTAACARSWEQTAQENPAYSSAADEDCYVISGTQGSLAVPTMRLKSFAPGDERSWFTPLAQQVLSLQRADPIQRQMAHFGAVVRGEAAPLVGVRDGLANLRVTAAIAEAAASGATVRLAP